MAPAPPQRRRSWRPTWLELCRTDYAAVDVGGLWAWLGHNPRCRSIFSITSACSMKASSRALRHGSGPRARRGAQPSGDDPHCSGAAGTHEGIDLVRQLDEARPRPLCRRGGDLTVFLNGSWVLSVALPALASTDISIPARVPHEVLPCVRDVGRQGGRPVARRAHLEAPLQDRVHLRPIAIPFRIKSRARMVKQPS
jgi:hypothetical protein